MTKYHIDKNGKPAICRATKRPCPLGGADVHFDSIEDAQAYADEQNAKEFGLLHQRPKVKASNDYVNNELYINVGDKPLDIDYYYDTGATSFDEVADAGELYKFDLQEYADDVMDGYESLDENGKKELLDAIEYNDWIASGNEGSVEDYVYGEGLEEFLEYTDQLVEVQDGKVEYTYELTSRDEIISLADSLEEAQYDDRDDLERDYRRSVGF